MLAGEDCEVVLALVLEERREENDGKVPGGEEWVCWTWGGMFLARRGLRR